MSRRRLSDEEHSLWRGITRSIAPLRDRRERGVEAPAAAEPVRTRAKIKPQPMRATPVPASAGPPPLAPLGRRFKQDVARGRRAIDGRLDLHGMTQAQAHGALLSFLRSAQARGGRTVLLITGKGAPGDDFASERGVLRRQVPLWLRLPEFRHYVVGFEAAHIGHGGEGALYVSLRRSRA